MQETFYPLIDRTIDAIFSEFAYGVPFSYGVR